MTKARIIWGIAFAAALGIFAMVAWALSGQTGGDRYDEQAGFFLKGLAAMATFAVLLKFLQSLGGRRHERSRHQAND